MSTEFGTGQFSSWNAWHSGYFRPSLWEIQLKHLLNGFSELNGCLGDINDIKYDPIYKMVLWAAKASYIFNSK